MDDETIDSDYLTLLHDKGKRSRRRELEAVREPGHLLKWYAAQNLHLNYVSTRETGLFRQFMRAYRHSCHAACCMVDAYVKRHERRQDRHKVREELSHIPPHLRPLGRPAPTDISSCDIKKSW